MPEEPADKDVQIAAKDVQIAALELANSMLIAENARLRLANDGHVENIETLRDKIRELL